MSKRKGPRAFPPPPVCRSVSDDIGQFVCELPKGHDGPHEVTTTLQWQNTPTSESGT